MKHPDWTAQEKQIIRDHAHEGYDVLCKMLPHRTRNAICTKAADLGQRVAPKKSTPKKPRGAWSEEEDQILIDNAALGMAAVLEKLPNRTADAIKTRANVKGVKLKRVVRKWSPEAIEILKQKAPYGIRAVKIALPTFTETSIRCYCRDHKIKLARTDAPQKFPDEVVAVLVSQEYTLEQVCMMFPQYTRRDITKKVYSMGSVFKQPDPSIDVDCWPTVQSHKPVGAWVLDHSTRINSVFSLGAA